MDLIGIVRIGACVERRLGFELTTRCGASADPTRAIGNLTNSYPARIWAIKALASSIEADICCISESTS